MNATTFVLSVDLHYTGGGGLEHFAISFRVTEGTQWNPLENVAAVADPDSNSSLSWSGVITSSEFIGMGPVEFQVTLINELNRTTVSNYIEKLGM